MEKRTSAKTYRVGEKMVLKNEMIAEIIAYRTGDDIDIRYDDGVIREHVKYSHFFQQSLPRPDKKPILWHRFYPKKKDIGRKKRTLFGYRTLLDVHDDNTIDYIDDDGTIIKNGCYTTFLYQNMILGKYRDRDGTIKDFIQ